MKDPVIPDYLIRRRHLANELKEAVSSRTPEETIRIQKRCMVLDPGQPGGLVMKTLTVATSAREEVIRGKIAELKIAANSQSGGTFK